MVATRHHLIVLIYSRLMIESLQKIKKVKRSKTSMDMRPDAKTAGEGASSSADGLAPMKLFNSEGGRPLMSNLARKSCRTINSPRPNLATVHDTNDEKEESLVAHDIRGPWINSLLQDS